jgi:hypothetical protein
MTKKDLFKIILKLIGLFLAIEIIVQIPSFGYFIYFESNSELKWLVLTVPALSIAAAYVLLFKPIYLINLFKLDKGFENNELAISAFNGKSVTKIALVIIAVFLIASNLGDFLTQIFFSFRESVKQNSLESLLSNISPYTVDFQTMFNAGINLMVGFLLLTNNTRISNWIEKMNAKNLG